MTREALAVRANAKLCFNWPNPICLGSSHVLSAMDTTVQILQCSQEAERIVLESCMPDQFLWYAEGNLKAKVEFVDQAYEDQPRAERSRLSSPQVDDHIFHIGGET